MGGGRSGWGLVLCNNLVYNIIQNHYTLLPLHPPLMNLDPQDLSTEHGLRSSAEIYGRKTVFHECLEEARFALTEISKSLRKPPMIIIIITIMIIMIVMIIIVIILIIIMIMIVSNVTGECNLGNL